MQTDTVGTAYPSIKLTNGNDAGYATITTTNNGGLSVSGYCYTPNYTPSTYYSYWPYYTDQTPRIAALEGEVKVLREMLAALLSGREILAPKSKTTKRAR